MLGGRHHIEYDMDKDMVWRWDQVLKIHPNGMRFSVFGEGGDLLATNEYFRYVNDTTYLLGIPRQLVLLKKRNN